jgi:AcrR family transcriptional regulator
MAELRADAARNREALVVAAREVMGAQGLDAPFDEIARRAGIGNATLYRRFPRRIDLIAAVFADRMAEHAAAVDDALAAADAWAGFCGYVEKAAAMQVHDRGIADLVTLDLAMAPEIEALRAAAFDGMVRVIERAKTSGALRADCTAEDVLVIQQANAGVVERAHRAAEPSSRRLIHLLLDGLRAASATDGPPPPSRKRMLQARRDHSRRLGLTTVARSQAHEGQDASE